MKKDAPKRARPRLARLGTPAIVVGSLVSALALTALGDSRAQAQRGEAPKHTRLQPTHDATELRVLDWTLWNVSKYYVEPGRIDPQAMTMAGLEALENTIAEVLVESVAKGQRVRVRVGTAEREFEIGDVEALWAVGPHVREVFRFVVRNTDLTEEQQREAEYAIVAGVLTTLDPHTNLLRPQDFADMKASTKGSFGGLGIEVGMREGAITVIRVIEGNPASKADMQPGDRIVQIDSQSTVAMPLNDAVGLLRGAPGTTVAVYVLRDGLDRPKKLEITRATIQLDSVVGDVLVAPDENGKPRKVGLVQIPRNFAQTTGRELRDKLDEFRKAGVEGVVLDLRDNPGGLLNAAVEVADAFVSSGTIVSTVGVSSPREDSPADDRYDFADLPLVVLVDQGSASASEIVAGALRNLGRGVVMGRRTFGKGSVQALHERKVGDKELALKLTIAQYLTPGDVSIQSVGVSPDIETIPVWIGKEHIQYFGRDRFDLLREESLTAHLESDKVRNDATQFGPLYFLDDGSVGEDEGGEKPATTGKKKEPLGADARSKMLLEDPEIRIARDLVLAAPSADRDQILAGVADFVRKQTDAEQERVRQSFAQRSIDWSRGAKPTTGAAKLRMAITSDKTGNVIKGGERGTVTVSIANEGDAPAFQVRAITDSDYRYFDERELMFGRIDPGATKTYSLKLSVAEHELSRTDRIDFHLFEQHAAKPAKGSQTWIDVSAEGLSRPQFAFGWQIIDERKGNSDIRGNGDGALQVGERVKLRVTVQNVGEGPALDPWVTLRPAAGEAIFVNTGRAKLDKMKPGQSHTVELDFEVNSQPEEGEAKLQLAVSDNKLAEVLSDNVSIPIEGAVELEDTNMVVTSTGAVDLYATPLGRPHVVARTDAGAKFKATAKTGEWVRLDLGDGVFAFAKASEVDQAGKGSVKPGKWTAVLAVSPPRIAFVGAVTQTDEEAIHLSGTATDEDAVRDLFITVYNPSRNLFGDVEKVFYQASADPTAGKLEWAADVPLTPGNNLVEVHARQNGDVVGIRRMWVLRTSGLAAARAKEAKFNGNGHARVEPQK